MRTRLGYIAFSTVILAVLGGLAVAQATTDLAAPEKIVLQDRTVRYADVNLGDKAYGPGDSYMMKANLYDQAGTTQVGRAHFQCTLQPGKAVSCTGAFFIFGRGEIVGQGVIYGTDAPFDVPITGGTGEFDNVRGYAHFEPKGPNHSTDTLHLLP